MQPGLIELSGLTPNRIGKAIDLDGELPSNMSMSIVWPLATV